MGSKQSKNNNGKVYNKKVHKRRKMYMGFQLEKNPDNGGLGIEANVQMAYNFDKDTKYEEIGENTPTNEIEVIPEE